MLTEGSLVAAVTLKPNLSRIIAALHHLMLIADQRRQRLSQYQLVKALFLADRSHLNQFGRPVTYDNYVAMEHGPVPSMSYRILREDPTIMAEISSLPWSSRIKAG